MSEHRIIANENDIEIEDTSHLGNIDRPFDPKKVDISTKQMILEVIFSSNSHYDIQAGTGSE